jgi:DNA mismatch endonuclease (patch repair protein)
MDKLSPIQRSKLMSKVRGSNTVPERQLRSAMWRIGIRFRLGQRIGRVRPDVVFKRARLAVFVDGCFWHVCPIHGSKPKSNEDFWNDKLARNVARDSETTAVLQEAGWTVLRFWEHEVETDAVTCALRVADALEASRISRRHR